MCVGGITNHNQLFEEILDIRMNFSLEYVHNLHNSIPRRIISEPRDLLRSIKGRFFMVFIINTRFFLTQSATTVTERQSFRHEAVPYDRGYNIPIKL